MSTPEDIREDGRRDDAEDKRREFLEQRSRMGGPEAPEPCETCGGEGSFWQKRDGGSLSGSRTLCPRCLGSKVQP